MNRPWLQLYTRDFLDDLALRSCTPESRSFLTDAMCLSHECTPYGHLADSDGAPLPEKFICGRFNVTPLVMRRSVAQLLEKKRLGKTPEGVLFLPRMVRDETIRIKRAAGGRLGGNPSLSNKVNHQDNHNPKKKVNFPLTLTLTSNSEEEEKKQESLLGNPLEESIQKTARWIHARHEHRKCALKLTTDKLRTITEKEPVESRLSVLEKINEAHKVWCASVEWTEEGGRFQKSLEFWLTPSKRRWEASPSNFTEEPRAHSKDKGAHLRAQIGDTA